MSKYKMDKYENEIFINFFKSHLRLEIEKLRVKCWSDVVDEKKLMIYMSNRELYDCYMSIRMNYDKEFIESLKTVISDKYHYLFEMLY